MTGMWMRGGGSSAGGGWECGRERGGRVRGEVRLWVFDVSGSDGDGGRV